MRLAARENEQEIEGLEERVGVLTADFERTVAEEIRLHDEIQSLERQITTRRYGDIDPAILIRPELAGDPITITVRTEFLQQKIRLAPASEQDPASLKRGGVNLLCGSLVSAITDALQTHGIRVDVDPERVSILTDTSRAARFATWAEESSTQQ